MVERRNRARLAFELCAQIRIARKLARQDLDRDGAIEPRVPRAVDLAHAARAERREDVVRAEARAGTQIHFFKDTDQFSTTLIGSGGTSATSLLTRNRWPSNGRESRPRGRTCS